MHTLISQVFVIDGCMSLHQPAGDCVSYGDCLLIDSRDMAGITRCAPVLSPLLGAKDAAPVSADKRRDLSKYNWKGRSLIPQSHPAVRVESTFSRLCDNVYCCYWVCCVRVQVPARVYPSFVRK